MQAGNYYSMVVGEYLLTSGRCVVMQTMPLLLLLLLLLLRLLRLLGR